MISSLRAIIPQSAIQLLPSSCLFFGKQQEESRERGKSAAAVFDCLVAMTTNVVKRAPGRKGADEECF